MFNQGVRPSEARALKVVRTREKRNDRRYAKLKVVDAFRQIEERKKKVVELKSSPYI